MRALLLFSCPALTALLASCAQVIMVGPHRNAISQADIQDIKRAAWRERELRSTALFIRPVARDRVAGQSGSAHVEHDQARYHTFTASKTSGQWVIDRASVQPHIIVVTY